MEKAKVAVIGAGPSGLSMLKALRNDGFAVTLYERRNRVGGLWAYSENPTYTTALPVTRANISKFTCGFTDFPIPDKYPTYMQPHEYQEFMHEYAVHFDLLKDIVFNTTVKTVVRNASDTKWVLDLETSGKAETIEFDKVALCNGYQTEAKVPTFEGQELFEGTIMHSQAYRGPEQFKGKKVVVLGLTSTSGDIVPDLVPHAEKVYCAHRRGAMAFRRYYKGTPQDLMVTWRRRRISHIMQKYAPGLTMWLAGLLSGVAMKRAVGKPDPAWGLEPYPHIMLALPGSWELILPLLRNGSVTSIKGIKRFLGPKSIEFNDGTVLDDIDAVILCTGYKADWSLVPWLEKSKPKVEGYGGSDLYRMYMNMFPPKYADSITLQCYSAFGKNNGFSFADVMAMAVSNVWRGAEKLPSQEEMEHHIDEHQKWIAHRWSLDNYTDTSAVKQWEFQAFLHDAAGTGMENLGWGWKGWAFWLRDRKMYNLMNHGVDTAHAFRYFETGKRPAWEGARDAIIHANEMVKVFPMKEVPWPPPDPNQ